MNVSPLHELQEMSHLILNIHHRSSSRILASQTTSRSFCRALRLVSLTVESFPSVRSILYFYLNRCSPFSRGISALIAEVIDDYAAITSTPKRPVFSVNGTSDSWTTLLRGMYVNGKFINGNSIVASKYAAAGVPIPDTYTLATIDSGTSTSECSASSVYD